jgi:hypothetical protein
LWYPWTEKFESYTPDQPLAGQGGWTTPSGCLSPYVRQAGENQYVQQVAGSTKSAAAKDLRYLKDAGYLFYRGYVKAWVYDPMITGNGDTRVGVHSSQGNSSIHNMFTAQITGAGTGSSMYWRAQWSYSPVTLDGVTPGPIGAGYTFTAGPQAYRSLGWHNAMIRWSYNDTAGTAHIEWYIDLNTNDPVANLMLDFNSTSSRWANSQDIAGVFIGSLYGAGAGMGYVDDIQVYLEFVPEPSSLLVLSAGVLGLAGMLRRRK